MHQPTVAAATRRGPHPVLVVALVIGSLLRLLSIVSAGLLVLDLLTSGFSEDEVELPHDDPSVVLPALPTPVVDRALIGAGYQCLTELITPVTVIGCYRSDDELWVDLRYRVKDGAIVGFTLDGGSSDNGDAEEFAAQAKIITRIALDAAAGDEVLQGAERAIVRNAAVRVDTHSPDGWTGTARSDADQWSDDFGLAMSSASDHDSRYVEPARLPGAADDAEETLYDLGYECETTGALRECDSPVSGLDDWAGTITVVESGDGISRITAEWEDLAVLADFITVLRDADPSHAALLTTAVVRGNDGHDHHVTIDGLMVASSPATVSVFGVDWGN